MDRLKIVSWNLLHSVGAGVEHVQALIAQYRPDLLLMQEAAAGLDRLPAHIGGHYARTPLPGRHHGLAAWSPLPFTAAARVVPLQRGLIVRRVCQIIELQGF